MSKKSFMHAVRNTFLQISTYSNVATKQTPAEYCFELVRKHDYENFLCTLSLSSKTRAAGFAIRAFNVEVAQVQDQIRDYKIGEMRIKFWTDALNETYRGNPPRSPVMLELYRILQKCSLSKRYFKRLIDIRLERLRNYLFLDMNEVEKYAEYSTSSIYYLMLEAHNITDINADHAASHMGKAHGIINLIRSIPHNARDRVNMLPQDTLMRHNVSTEAIFQGQMNQGLQNVIYDITSCGKLHLDVAISLKSKLDKNVDLIFLPIVCLERYINELRKVDFNVFDTRLQKRDSLLPMRVLWKKLLH
ncbi:PREDICTED: NADH dehydrogenase (ubiquinone) complex I, assembly factor 6 [Dufourea novaeangliae]|uniref:NADH dehydrogenase (ubiquinone) complex I, assembly factor 6 n=1 Tax=Dufourea novaeangliae TaxID=178035 RepID=UPI0007677819|nr:PREDICTED: NADH dehydrogenase (ubiquinone) complex I, assembly factor 6 [Dufourea novaeangliae]